MADSILTKKALANSLMELMNEKPFEKISVTDICERCGMNRKSFYYHFQDKYELVNWIFDQQFLKLLDTYEIEDRWDLLEKAFKTFYENHDFYRHAFMIEGYNSFSEHFREIITPIAHEVYTSLLQQADAYNGLIEKYFDFYIDVHADVFIIAIQKWLSVKDCMSDEEFTEFMKMLVVATTKLVKSDLLDFNK